MWKWNNPLIIGDKIDNSGGSGDGGNGYAWRFSKGGHLSTIGNINRIIWSNGVFVLVGGINNFSTVITSIDGELWTRQASTAIAEPIKDIAPYHSKWKWLAISTTAPSTGHVWGSTNTSQPVGFGKYFDAANPVSAIAYNDSIAVIVGYKDILYSTTGIGWNTISNVTSVTLYDVAWSPDLGLFCTVGGSGAIYTSSNGTSWTQKFVAGGFSGTITFVKWVGQQFIAGGQSGTLLRSTDGNNWTKINTGFSTTLQDIIKINDVYFITGSGYAYILTTKDLQTFDVALSGTSGVGGFRKLAYSNTLNKLVTSCNFIGEWGDFEFIVTLNI